MGKAIGDLIHGHCVGGKKSKEYCMWQNMIHRCTVPTDADWMSYGGRGINVCEKWKTFLGFIEDVGTCPVGLTLDRKNVNGNYEPGNWKWSDRREQALNRRPVTHCRRGHLFTKENTYRIATGRYCKTCERTRAEKKSKARKRNA